MLAQIETAGDPRLEPYRHVGSHDWLCRQGLFVAEGRLVVSRLIDAGRYDIESVLVTPGARVALGARLDGIDCDVLVAGQAMLNEVTGFNFHRGCLALARRAPPRPPEDLEHADRLLALEGVGNPDNVGGLFRAASALGAGGILLGPATGDPLYRKAIRTSMGAVLQLPWALLEPWPAGLEAFRARGFRIVALTPRGELTLSELASRHDPRLILLAGAEGAGLTAAALSAVDHRVRIPIAPGVDSLNVTVAAAIALQTLRAR